MMRLSEETNMYVVAVITSYTLFMGYVLAQMNPNVVGFGIVKKVYTALQSSNLYGLVLISIIGANAIYNPSIAIALLTFYTLVATLPPPEFIEQVNKPPQATQST